MRCAKRIVFAFAALGEPAQPATLAQRADAITPPGQDLVRIALVADIPHQLVLRRVENIMDCGCQLDHAQSRSQMAPGGADGIDHFGAQFVGQLAELVLAQLAQIVGCIDRIEEGGLGATCHTDKLYTRETQLSMNALSPQMNGLAARLSARNRRIARAVRPPGGHR